MIASSRPGSYSAKIEFYAANEGTVKVTIKDNKDQAIKTIEAKAFKGLNGVEWDLKSESTNRVVAAGEYSVEIQAGNSLDKKPLRVTSRFTTLGY
jgi:flagellar hook assembly protein FlgD